MSRSPRPGWRWLPAVVLLLPASAPEANEGELPIPPEALPPIDLFAPDQRLNLNLRDGIVLAVPPDEVRVHFRAEEFDLLPSSLELWIDGTEYTQLLSFWLEDAVLLILDPEGFWIEGPHVVDASIRDVNGATFDWHVDWELARPACFPDCPWPFDPQEDARVVGNLMEDFQDFNVANGEYWHRGLDIRVADSTEVLSITGGTVVQVINYKPWHTDNSLYWEVAVQDPSGYVWQYHHLDSTSVAVSMGDPVGAGQVLGRVATWPDPVNGELYHHLHLNVARWTAGGPVPGPYIDGWDYYNPLDFLGPGSYVDTEVPVEIRIMVSRNQADSAFAGDLDLSPPVVSGAVDVLAQLEETMTPIGSGLGQPYELGLFDLEYEVELLDPDRCGRGTIPRTRLARFHEIPGPPGLRTRQDVLNTIYKKWRAGITGGMFYEGMDHGARFNNSTRRFTYSMTNTYFGVWDPVRGVWDTARRDPRRGPLYPDGDYVFRIHAMDHAGNPLAEQIHLVLDNGIPFIGLCPSDVNLGIEGLVEMIYPPLGPSFSPVGSIPMSFGPGGAGSGRGGREPAAPGLAPAEASPPGTVLTATVGHLDWPVMVFDYPAAKVQFGIGLLDGQVALAEYVPVLGDLILEAPAEIQILQPGQVFDPTAPPANLVDLRLSTRLARDPETGLPVIGAPHDYGSPALALALAGTAEVDGTPFTLRTKDGEPVSGMLDFGRGGVPSEGRVRFPMRAFPNPTVSGTTVRFGVEKPLDACLDVLDVSGRRLRSLGCRTAAPGENEAVWDGRTDRGRRVPAGVYFIRLRTEGRTREETVKIIVLDAG